MSVEVKQLTKDELDNLPVGSAAPAYGKNYAVLLRRGEHGSMHAVGRMYDEADAEVSGRALAEHYGGEIIVKSDNRAVKFVRVDEEGPF